MKQIAEGEVWNVRWLKLKSRCQTKQHGQTKVSKVLFSQFLKKLSFVSFLLSKKYKMFVGIKRFLLPMALKYWVGDNCRINRTEPEPNFKTSGKVFFGFKNEENTSYDGHNFPQIHLVVILSRHK